MADSILKFPDRLRIEGVMAKGYGIICKYPMQDTDLDIAAKAVYSLLCALAGSAARRKCSSSSSALSLMMPSSRSWASSCG